MTDNLSNSKGIPFPKVLTKRAPTFKSNLDCRNFENHNLGMNPPKKKFNNPSFEKSNSIKHFTCPSTTADSILFPSANRF